MQVLNAFLACVQCKKICTLHFWHLRLVTKFCTLQFITYPDVVYKVATAMILIQTRGVQSVFSLENACAL